MGGAKLDRNVIYPFVTNVQNSNVSLADILLSLDRPRLKPQALAFNLSYRALQEQLAWRGRYTPLDQGRNAVKFLVDEFHRSVLGLDLGHERFDLLIEIGFELFESRYL